MTPVESSSSSLWNSILRRSDLLFAAAIVTTVLVLVLPLPTFMIDVALTLSIAVSLMVMMTVIYVKEPVQFAGFPTILLFVTLYRLALNVATTRSILDRADAGHLINAFGNFVIGGNFVVGIVVFCIIVTINFIVITKGAGRVSEVAARFTLDALPGKQMSIDADLNAGNITDADARKRRAALQDEASFYGAMDGASKFVRGDAVAGILITFINILGGFAIGILQKGMAFKDAAQHYSLLTVGDGLVTQIPALLISVASGILVTRGPTKENLGEDIAKQMFGYHKALYSVSAILAIFIFIPGFPWWAFLILSVGVFLLARVVEKNTAAEEFEARGGHEAGEKTAKPAVGAEKADSWLKVEPLQLEIGYNLVSFLDKDKGGDLLDRVTSLRKSVAAELGIVISPIRIRDNPMLGGNHYCIQLRGSEIARGEVTPNQFLAMGVGTSGRPLHGRTVTEPVFGLPATWISETERRVAEQLGLAVVDPISVLVTHLAETIRQHAHQLLTRQDTSTLLDQLKEVNAAVVGELVPGLVSIGVVHRVLQNLLREGVSIRNLGAILEKVADYAGATKNPDELSEQARKALGGDLVRHLLPAGQNALSAITLDPELEHRIAQSLRPSQHEVSLALEPPVARHLYDGLANRMKEMASAGLQPLVICSPTIRLALRRFFEGTFRNLTVVAYNELPERTQVQSIGMVPNVA